MVRYYFADIYQKETDIKTTFVVVATNKVGSALFNRKKRGSKVLKLAKDKMDVVDLDVGLGVAHKANVSVASPNKDHRGDGHS